MAKLTGKAKAAFLARMAKGKKGAKKKKVGFARIPKKRELENLKQRIDATMKTTTGYIVSSPRYPNGRIFASKDDAIKEYHRQQKYGGAGYSDKTTIRSKNPKYHKRGKYWTP